MTLLTLELAHSRRPAIWRRRWFEWLSAGAIYVTLVLTTTWPLIQSPTTSLPMGTTQAVTVPLFNLWTIWWNADRATKGFSGYWDAPIFHPARDSFAFSELQPTTLIVAPIIWITDSRVLAYNVYLWLSLILNGVFAEHLLRVLNVRSWAAIAGGAGMVMLPIVHWQLDVIQLAPIWGILWTWTACWQMVRLPHPTAWRQAGFKGLEAGTALSITFHACGHHGLFLGLLLAMTGWLLPRRWNDRRMWLSIAMACVSVALLVGPFAIHMSRAMKANNFVRTESLIASLSALPQDYLAAPGTELLDLGAKWCRPYWRLSPGWVKVGLVLFAATMGVVRRRTRRWTLFMLLTIALSFALSLGTNLRVGDWQAWTWLAQYVPGMGQVRNVFRFAFFTQIAVVILATQAVWWLWLITRSRLGNRPCLRTVMSVVCLGIAGTAAFEVRPYRLVLGGTPNEVANAAWIEFVQQQTPEGSGIVCLPFPKGYQCNDFEQTTRWMYYGTFHGVPLVNGYSGFFPAEYFRTQEALNAPANYGAILSKLETERVHFVVVSQPDGKPERTATFGRMQLELVFADPIGVNVYRLRRLPPIIVPLDGSVPPE